MREVSVRVAFVGLVTLMTACGSEPPPRVAESTPPAVTAKPFVPEPDAPDDDDQGPTSDRAPKSATPAAASIVKLASLLTATSSGFPHATQGDATCSDDVELVGNAERDFSSLVKQCGAATGMSEYVRSSSGNLEASSHPSDTYDLTMQGGLCYRYFVVGDSHLAHFKASVQRPNGSVLSMTETREGVILLNPKKAWCKRHDREFHIVIESRGSSGAYTFGVWARPAQ